MRKFLAILGFLPVLSITAVSVVACDVVEFWRPVGTRDTDKKINYEFKINTLYRVGYSWNVSDKGAIKYLVFKYMGETTILDEYILDVANVKVLSNFVHLIVSELNNISLVNVGNDLGRLVFLEEGNTDIN